MDWNAARAFVAAVPEGRWTSYGDVAAAGGSPRGAQAVGQWTVRRGAEIPHVHRVLSSDGRVAERWVPAAAGLPPGPRQVRVLLECEGVPFVGDRAVASARFRLPDWR